MQKKLQENLFYSLGKKAPLPKKYWFDGLVGMWSFIEKMFVQWRPKNQDLIAADLALIIVTTKA